MRSATAVVAAILTLALISPTYVRAAQLTDDDIRARIIANSIAAYPGHCPCPYNVARNGSRCGRRSAYSRPGGYSPICFATDVTGKMIADYRRNRG